MERGTEQEKGDDQTIPWHDYRHADVVIALRPDHTDPYYDKPASKLINAWRAGTPALLGPEYPFQELYRSPLDYIEVRSPADVLEALKALRDDPARYAAMVRRGRDRAAEYTDEMLTQRWADLLFGHATRRYLASRASVILHLPAGLRRVVRTASAPPSKTELAFCRRWYGEVADQMVHGKLRPWFGRTRLGRLRRRLAGRRRVSPPDAPASSPA